VSFDNFRAASDINIPFEPRLPENFTTSTVSHETLLEFAKVCKKARIVNLDATNNLIVRLHSNRGTARTIPPNSDAEIQEWFTLIVIEPDGTTGTGQLELDLVKVEDALQLGLIR